MKKCLICGAAIDDHRDFCTVCYQKKKEMERRGLSDQAMELREASDSDPLGGDTIDNFLS